MPELRAEASRTMLLTTGTICVITSTRKAMMIVMVKMANSQSGACFFLMVILRSIFMIGRPTSDTTKATRM